MTTTLIYNFVAAHEEDDVLTVGFADSQFQTREYLMFQRWIDAEEAGEDDEIHIERDGQEQGIYGGIEQFVLSHNRVVLRLSSETAMAVGTQQDVHIEFSATDEQFRDFKKALEKLFEGLSIFEMVL